MYTHRHMYTHTYMYIHAETCTDTYMYRHTYTPPPKKKLQYFIVHSQIRVLHSSRWQRAQHPLSLSSTIEQSDGSQCQ
ncbi:unnamed protein product [Staurois parvus]|uniref:Uncharacterized protein n=1 Tax=Staurois parvus TaxID=386267 RepID=A0ABN9EGC6_9NEOB|nr:unnamed protein product [Staurois parvus]